MLLPSTSTSLLEERIRVLRLSLYCGSHIRGTQIEPFSFFFFNFFLYFLICRYTFFCFFHFSISNVIISIISVFSGFILVCLLTMMTTISNVIISIISAFLFVFIFMSPNIFVFSSSHFVDLDPKICFEINKHLIGLHKQIVSFSCLQKYDFR